MVAPSTPAPDEFATLAPASPPTLGQRTALAVTRAIAPPVLLALGSTLHVELPQGVPPGAFSNPPSAAIYVFWHRCLLPMAWFARHRGIGVLISQHFDGEVVAQVALRLGYTAFRGSSTRGGQEALQEMAAALRRGQSVALTVDGPRGPRFRAKGGAIQLARITGAPIFAVHVSVAPAWTLATWDTLQVPRPFGRLRGFWHGPLPTPPPDASPAEIERLRHGMETTLNQLREAGDAALASTIQP